MRRLGLIGLALLIAGAGWVGWDRFGPRPPAPPMAPEATRIDHILIEKSARRLTATLDGAVVMQADIALGFAPDGNKEIEGDGKTPVGLFRIDRRNPNSAFHLSLGIDYPQPDDIKRARQQGTDPGGDIFIHGQPNGVAGFTLPGDWTLGCIALSNAEMAQLWTLTETGTTVEIRP
ncbi:MULTISPECIES: murein L,D-transpeptidase family protein [unclassified Ruegeria]|uniref:L,D-transpeptidase family protein n=1 Tax=unclassified Ruegeria TaxID=2625375 RepID=UPI0014880DDF|nr:MULTISPECIES: L,D-transpeptidase family protein [unclassified Ruegeria]NOD78156.1 L,D-transpeptidase family protein [Ruegeria sp. HKCCD4332]NOD90724.1 L,D-transpeptidase family protein [Ruegeria sp. HKCCD4318]NOE15773.1 L,D-transpeptidase family protein [Ruegeria sp. HKCCD4318-2]NOG07954.1 L,D-transpeptidase family protein [Ruegeria sp. HKCCD4315]